MNDVALGHLKYMEEQGTSTTFASFVDFPCEDVFSSHFDDTFSSHLEDVFLHVAYYNNRIC